MFPSPKLPTSRSPLKRPKLSGATARPQGAFSWPCCATRSSEVPLRVECVDETAALPGDLVLGVLVLLGVCDEHPVADRLDLERCVAGRQARVDEPAVGHESEVTVEDVDPAVVEVGRVERGPGRGVRDREALVDRPVAKSPP